MRIGLRRKSAAPISRLRASMAAPEMPVDSIMHEHPAPLDPEDPSGKVAQLAAKYNLFSLPVQKQGKLLGVVTVDDVLARVLHG